jgi:hypothetical protein
MKRLLPVVVLTFTAGAACSLDLAGLQSAGSGGGSAPATTTSMAGPGGGAANASSSGDPGTTSASGSSTSTGGGPLWTRRRKLDLDSGQLLPVDGFPLLVRLEKTRIDYGQTQSSGQDLRFVDDQGTVLPHEIESWNQNGISLIWVRIPTVKVKVVFPLTSIYMYYGNPGAADTENAHGVWSSGYHGVWHLSEGGDSFTDSSGKTAASAKNYGSTQLGASVLGKGRSFKGSSQQYIDTLNSENLTTFTIEAWVRSSKAPSTSGGPSGPLMREQNYQFTWDHSDSKFTGTANFKAPSPQDWVASALNATSPNTWYYLAATYDGLGLSSYTNGARQGLGVLAGGPLPESNSAKIGRHAYGTEAKHFFDGDIDEVRIAQGAQPIWWFAAQYKSMTDAGFVTYGAEASGSWAVP